MSCAWLGWAWSVAAVMDADKISSYLGRAGGKGKGFRKALPSIEFGLLRALRSGLRHRRWNQS
jgi:hypothetical protein